MTDTRTKIILASGSPRRRELLAAMQVEFEVVPSSFEEQLDDGRTPEEVASELALGKAKDVAVKFPDQIVLGADTIVTVEGKQLGKPVDADDALQTLKLLAGREHAVTTGVAIVKLSDGVELVAAETSIVYFRPYDNAAAMAYVRTGDPLDKAGSYGIQSGGAPLIDSIKGNYDTIIGLPTVLVSELLQKLGVPAYPVEPEPTVPQRS
jgi:septum formation protein